MARQRKTKAQQRSEWDALERRAWETFLPKLEAIQSFAEGEALVKQAPAPDSPGRKFYSNLGFFLMTFAPPDGASGAELLHYRELVRKIDAAGHVKSGAMPEIEAKLQAAIDHRRQRGY